MLANDGYILDWMYYQKGNIGPVDLDEFFTKKLGFSKTQAVVLDLLNQKGILDKFDYIVWLDNLSTSSRLLSFLEEQGFGAAGTVRTTGTEREIQELKRNTRIQQEQLRKDYNRSMHPDLVRLRTEHNSMLE